MPDKLFSNISVVPSQLQSDIDLTKKMKQRTNYVKIDWRTALIHTAKVTLRRMGRVCEVFSEGSEVYTRYTVDIALLERDMKDLFGPHWRCG